MISAITYFLIFCLVVLLAIFNWMTDPKRNSKLPPGPKPWPLLGNMLNIIGKDLHLVLTDMSRRFGPLVWLKLGTENVLVINDIDSTMEAFVGHGKIYSGRPARRKTVDLMLGTGHDIVMSDGGERLKFYRHIVHSYMTSQFCDQRERLYRIISHESDSLVKEFGQMCEDGVAFDPKLHISRLAANVLCQSVLNNRFESVNDDLMEQLSIVQDIVDSLESFNVVDLIPSLEYMPIPSLIRFKKSLARKDSWINRIIAEHRETMGDTDRDLLDILLRHQDNARDSNDEKRLEMLSDVTIGHIVYELFGGGIESSTLVVLWFIVYMLHYPQWQEEVSLEVRRVSSQRGGIHPNDRHLYPLLDSCIKETMRLATILPVGFPHRTTSHSRLRSYDVPKDTMVLTNIWAIHHDPNLWDDPHTFNPLRFMAEGKTVYRRGYLPFGIGSRICLGTTLAKMETFMFISHIVANFVITSGVSSLPDLHGPAGLTHRTRPYSILLASRTADT